MTIQEAGYFLTGQLLPVYGEGETEAMAGLLLEKITGKRGRALLAVGDALLPDGSDELLAEWTNRLLHHEPIQQVLGEAWFMEMKFFVNRSVLVPRPETEELVDWIIRDRSYNPDGHRLLDIGTGTGCIPVSLKKKMAGITADALDLSKDALTVATMNADSLGASVNFTQLDFLDPVARGSLGQYDIVVSNPPYIPLSDHDNMPQNVTGFEPAMALFVPDQDPLVFYKAIADFGLTHLVNAGRIYVEIYEGLGTETLEVFTSKGYQAILKTDMQGKDRFIRALKKA